jgi:prepilin-type N-terminal cleavage/methylation domain-containing protein
MAFLCTQLLFFFHKRYLQLNLCVYISFIVMGRCKWRLTMTIKGTTKGFTLIELMLVVMIIGVLSAIAVPRLFGATERARVSEAIQNIGFWERLQMAHVHLFNDYGDFNAVGYEPPTSTQFEYGELPEDNQNKDFLVKIVATRPLGDCTGDGNGIAFKSRFTSIVTADIERLVYTDCAHLVTNFNNVW